ncbi:MAG: OmpL47-type beta-barrel domain-containing protein [Phycisphaeraceae bacterium]
MSLVSRPWAWLRATLCRDGFAPFVVSPTGRVASARDESAHGAHQWRSLEPLEPRLLLSANPLGELLTDDDPNEDTAPAIEASLEAGDGITPALAGLSAPGSEHASFDDYSFLASQTSLEQAAIAPATGGADILYIRVDFFDETGDPVSEQAAEDSVLAAGEFMRDASWGEFWFDTVDVTETLRMPESSDYYASRGDGGALELEVDALAAVDNETDFNVNDYWSYAISFVDIGFFWAGLGYVGSPGIWLNGYGDWEEVVAHEFGHNIGAWHSSWWSVDDGDPLSEDGSIIEYGDPFDIMGDAYTGFPDNQFNTYWTTEFGWMDATDNVVDDPAANDTYRIYAHDIGDSGFVTDRDYAIRMPGVNDADFWLEYRQSYFSNQSDAGLEIRLSPSSWSYDQNTLLIDTTGGTGGSVLDAALDIGESFVYEDEDSGEEITITPTDTGVDNGNWWIDVLIADEDFISPDDYEPNDSFAAAHDLGALGTWTDDTLSIHEDGDEDYFLLTAHDNAYDQIEVSLEWDDTAGDRLDVYLYDSSETQLDHGFADDSTGTVTLSQAATAGEQYYVRVEAPGTDNITDAYTLTIDVDTDTDAPLTEHELAGDEGNDPWFLGPVEVTLSATDDESTVDKIEYRFDDADPWQTYAAPFTVSDEGITTLSYRATDSFGNVEETRSVDIHIDTGLPSSTISLDGEEGNPPWYTGPVEVTLDGTDANSGLGSLEYRFDDADPWQTYSDPFTVENEGTTTVSYRAVDVAGNAEATQTQDIHIDAGSPELTETLDGTEGNDPWFLSPVEVTLAAVDPTSNLEDFEYRFDPEDPWQTYTSPFTVSDEGIHTLSYRASDEAGNVELRNVDIHIDTSLPSSTIALDGDAGDNGWYLGPVQATLDSADDVSGLDSIEYRLDDADPWQTYTEPFTVSDEGTTAVSYRALDVAGNVEATQTQDIHVDTVAPSTMRTLVGDAGDGPWFVSTVDVTLSATDDTSGVADVEYRLDDADPWQAYSAPFTIGDDGITTLSYRATDEAGNVEVQTVDVHVDTTAPLATLDADDAEDAFAAYHDITVTYTDGIALSAATMIDNDAPITVLDPDSNELDVTYFAIDDATDGPQRTVTYRVAAPAGGWRSEHHGTYTVNLLGDEVTDTAGNAAAATQLGTFEVDLGTSIDTGPDNAHFLRFTDATNTTITLNLTGGVGEVLLHGDNLQTQSQGAGLVATGDNLRLNGIDITGTTARDALVIRGFGGNGRVTLGGIVTDSALGRLVAPNVDIANGELTIAGQARFVRLGNITEGRLTVDGALGTFRADRLTDTTLETDDITRLTVRQWNGGGVEATSLRLLNVLGGPGLDGDFFADLTLTGNSGPFLLADNTAPFTLTHANIRGGINDSDWNIVGHARTIRVTGQANDWDLMVNGDLRTLFTGAVTNTTVQADQMIQLRSQRWNSGSVGAESLRLLNITGARGVDGDFHADLTLTGGDARFTLTRAIVRGSVTGNDWNIAGDSLMVRVMGQASDWDLMVTGDLRSLLTATVSDSTVQAGEMIQLRSQRWDGGSISAESLRLLHVTGARGVQGDFAADLALSGGDGRFTFQRAIVRGRLTDATWDVVGDAGFVTLLKQASDWSFEVGGDLRSLLAHRDLDLDLLADGRVHRLLGRSNVTGSLDAASVGVMRVNKHLHNAELTLRADAPDTVNLDRLFVGRWLDNTDLHSTGSLGHLLVGGARDSSVMAGMNDAGDPTPALPTSRAAFDDHFDALAHVRRFAVRGLGVPGVSGEPFLVRNTDLVAGAINRADLRYVYTHNDHTPFGLATTDLDTYTRREPLGLYHWSDSKDTAPARDGDMVVRIL